MVWLSLGLIVYAASRTLPTGSILLGVITGVAGGIVRDVLVGEIPLVFRRETYCYATAAFAGATAYVLMERWLPGNDAGGFVGAGIIFVLRLASIQWKLSLPGFRVES